MADQHFFDEAREQSQVKAEIVEKYFDAWAEIITATQDQHPQWLLPLESEPVRVSESG
jgi:hypothetical protein